MIRAVASSLRWVLDNLSTTALCAVAFRSLEYISALDRASISDVPPHRLSALASLLAHLARDTRPLLPGETHNRRYVSYL